MFSQSLILILAVCLSIPCFLQACGKATYRDDLTASALSEQMVGALPPKTYLAAERDVLDGYFALPDYVLESDVRFSADGTDLDEWGIYHVTDGNVEAMATHLRQYTQTFYERYNANYLPEEIPKLRDAEVRIYGNYVIYAMLNDQDRTAFFQKIEETLRN